ncbi:hypothetical protein PPL_01962 [Heterostelium album PN500]|uniref:Ankyrin repeat-containing protein n=1 Tax=Heterostelium pallidum (strain ATCC 26659 / Pp 5 / PN500) TaxID=670386 RepID=D3B0Z4_HETP5|nr:hypothetical protein PPL_01962 [Heterostelium album PN500]EFA84968.1 hypothetical protein PPL_01962 [Heterostelium album PN500]|eukprot:XP_020437078.1 hypothetical protein PPL_01962 [Heterostelium album PN500]
MNINKDDDVRKQLFLSIIKNKVTRVKVSKYINLIHRQLYPLKRRYVWSELEEVTSIETLGKLRVFSLIYKQFEKSEELYNRLDWGTVISGRPLATNETKPSDLVTSTPSTSTRKRSTSTKYADFISSTTSKRKNKKNNNNNEQQHQQQQQLQENQTISVVKRHQFMSYSKLKYAIRLAVESDNLDLLKFVWTRYAFGKDHYSEKYSFIGNFLLSIAKYDRLELLKYALEAKILGIYELEPKIDYFLEKAAIKVIKYLNANYRFLLARKPLYYMAKSGDIEFIKSLKLTAASRLKAIYHAAVGGQVEMLEYLFDETGYDEELAIDSLFKILEELQKTGHLGAFRYLCERYNLDLRPHSSKLVRLFQPWSVQIHVQEYVRERIASFNRAEGLPTNDFAVYSGYYNRPVNIMLSDEQKEAAQIKDMISRTTDLEHFIYLYGLYGKSVTLNLESCDYPREIFQYLYDQTAVPKMKRQMPVDMINRGWDVIEFLFDRHPEFSIYNLYRMTILYNHVSLMRKYRSKYPDQKGKGFTSYIEESGSYEMTKYLNETTPNEVCTYGMHYAAAHNDLDSLLYLYFHREEGFQMKGLRRRARVYTPDIQYFLKYIYGHEPNEEEEEDEEKEEEKEDDYYDDVCKDVKSEILEHSEHIKKKQRNK